MTLVEGTDYQLVQAQRPYLVPLTAWPDVTGFDGITIEFVAGYGDAGADVPEPIRTAIVLAAGGLHSMSSRSLLISEEVVEGVGSTRYVVTANAGDVINGAVNNLLATYRVLFV